MKIQRLYIGDFGILRNQTLEDIHPGIVVIGGLNRAGKSTLMQVLRYLGYGFPQGRGLPPASSKYEAEADIRLDIGDVYNLKLSGHSQPILRRLSGTDKELMSAGDLYRLDDFTYGQLFTITLDELNRNDNMSSDDKRRLKSILLGAGFSDMLLIPQLEQEFYKEGDKIGGKKGSPKVKQFKPYYSGIEKGQRLKQKGLSQVGEYQQKQQELREKEDMILRLNKDIEELNRQVVQLDVIKNNYDAYLKLEELEAELRYKEVYAWQGGPSEYELERIKSLRDNYISLNRELQDREIELGIASRMRELLLNKKDEIASYKAGISGILERIRQLGQRRQEYSRKKQDLILRIKDTNGAWDERHIQAIAAINTDKIEQNRLSELVQNHKDLETRYRNHLDNLDRMEVEYDELEVQSTRVKENKPWLGVRKYFYFSLAFMLFGIILSFINPLSGILLGVGGVAGAAVYLVMSSLHSREAHDAVHDQKERLNALKARMQAEQNVVEGLVSQLNEMREELDHSKRVLGLSTQVSYSTLPGHLLRIKDIQDRIMELDELSQGLDRESGYLEQQYNRYIGFIGQFSEQEVDYTNNIGIGHSDEDWDEILSRLELWEDHLNYAREIKILQQKTEAVKNEITRIMERYESVEPSWHRDRVDQEIVNNPNAQDKGDAGGKIAEFIGKGEKAIEFAKVRETFEEVTQSVLSSMGSDAIKRAFDSSTDLVNTFKEKCGAYASREEAEEDYIRASEERDGKLDKLEELKEIRQKLKDDLQRLAAMENLAQGQRQIDNARAELKILAEQYAVNMMAAFLLREAGQSLLQGMKDSIMDSAGYIFSRMTSGHYRGIIPSEPLLESDFEAILHDQTSSQTIDMLSRGTREQLYLSVRLSRIMDIKPNLPIIIDDSFANFDSLHLGQSLGILSDLSKTHQIFILTCHGDLVEEIAKSECKAQYWKLERGTLDASDCEGLSRYLR